jgi:hypothetical protein
MMMAVVEFIVNVMGRRSAMAVGAPNPGSTPTIWPKNTPAAQQRMLFTVSATANP